MFKGYRVLITCVLVGLLAGCATTAKTKVKPKPKPKQAIPSAVSPVARLHYKHFSQPIFLDLPYNANVAVYDDHHVLYSAYLASGRSMISTRTFPHGYYPVTIVISTDHGKVMSVQKRFVRR